MKRKIQFNCTKCKYTWKLAWKYVENYISYCVAWYVFVDPNYGRDYLSCPRCNNIYIESDDFKKIVFVEKIINYFEIQIH